MARAEYRPFITGELSDEPIHPKSEMRLIRIGNCVIHYTPQTHTISFLTSGDVEWPFQSLNNFRRLLDYIEITYGR